MDKKIALGLAAGMATGVAIYLISKVMKEKKSNRQNEQARLARPKRMYAYEYTL